MSHFVRRAGRWMMMMMMMMSVRCGPVRAGESPTLFAAGGTGRGGDEAVDIDRRAIGRDEGEYAVGLGGTAGGLGGETVVW